MEPKVTYPWYRATCDTDQRGDKSCDPDSFNIRFSEVPVQLVQVEQGEHDTDHVDQNPQHVEHVVSEGAVHERAARSVVSCLGVGRQGTA